MYRPGTGSQIAHNYIWHCTLSENIWWIWRFGNWSCFRSQYITCHYTVKYFYFMSTDIKHTITIQHRSVIRKIRMISIAEAYIQKLLARENYIWKTVNFNVSCGETTTRKETPCRQLQSPSEKYWNRWMRVIKQESRRKIKKY